MYQPSLSCVRTAWWLEMVWSAGFVLSRVSSKLSPEHDIVLSGVESIGCRKHSEGLCLSHGFMVPPSLVTGVFGGKVPVILSFFSLLVSVGSGLGRLPKMPLVPLPEIPPVCTDSCIVAEGTKLSLSEDVLYLVPLYELLFPSSAPHLMHFDTLSSFT